MDQLISIVIFTIPGLLVYFWIQAFGLNPVVKHTPTELAAIATLFWLPAVVLMIIVYDILYFLVNLLFTQLDWNLAFLQMQFIGNLKDIQNSSNNILFIMVFFIESIVSSLLVAFIWVKFFDKKLLPFINRYRIKRKLTKLSDTTAVWDAFFHKLKNAEEEGLVVEIFKVDKSEDKIVGSVTKMSRPYETERSLVLEHTNDWMESVKKYDYKKERTYIDTKSGIVVTELNQQVYTVKPPVQPTASGSDSVADEQGADQQSVVHEV